MAYFETLQQNDTLDMQTIFSAANRISGNILMPVLLLVTYFVFILGYVFSGKPIGRAVLYSSFVCSILSILMVLMNWLSVTFMYFAFFMTAVGSIWVWLSEAAS